ncbi:MAG: rRNA maturation RNase YbeY [Steroidobacteraceae bacterium]
MKRTLATTARERGGRIDVEVTYGARRPWVPAPRLLRRWATAAICGPRRSRQRPDRAAAGIVSIVVVGEARSRRLNAGYRGNDKPTNVLSFGGAPPSPDGRRFWGELVICAPVVAREARAGSTEVRAHWAHMVVHGVLHLQGHDHETALEAVKMQSLETQILEQLGFSDPYR